MGKIAVILPINTFHANQMSATMSHMDRAGYGLPVFRKYQIPVTVFAQNIDMWMKPWLFSETLAGGCLEWGHAPFSHTLVSLFPGEQSMQSTLGQVGSIPVTFFPEFCLPRAEHIPTRFTLVLASNSTIYSGLVACEPADDVHLAQYLEAPSICFGGSALVVGILMRDFDQLLRAFFAFQRFPHNGSDPENRDRLAELIREIRKIADMADDRVVVMPIDAEAPWIGSFFGAEIWEILFEEVQRQGLSAVFTPLSAHLDRFAREAVKTSRPERGTGKWTTLLKQLEYIIALNKIVPRDNREYVLKMIAAGSDLLAAWAIKLQTKPRPPHAYLALRPSGEVAPILIREHQGYNQSVIEVQLAAFHALRHRTSMAEELCHHIRNPDYFVQLAITMAKRNGL